LQSCDDSEETLLPNVDELFNTEAKPLLGFLFKKVVLLQQAKQQMASVIAALELQEETQRQQQVSARLQTQNPFFLIGWWWCRCRQQLQHARRSYIMKEELLQWRGKARRR
jgi:hypothetical protein